MEAGEVHGSEEGQERDSEALEVQGVLVVQIAAVVLEVFARAVLELLVVVVLDRAAVPRGMQRLALWVVDAVPMYRKQHTNMSVRVPENWIMLSRRRNPIFVCASLPSRLASCSFHCSFGCCWARQQRQPHPNRMIVMLV